MSELNCDSIRELVEYEHTTGVFKWRHRSRKWFKNYGSFKAWNSKFPGSVAGGFDGHGHREVRILGVSYRAHRLAWAYMTGRWPDGQIDHINGDRADNRFQNLRVVDNRQNGMNCGMNRLNTSGFKGVTWNKSRRKWQAGVTIYGQYKYIGLFECPKEAHDAYAVAASRAGFTDRHISC